MPRIDKKKRAYGGAIKRNSPSHAARLINTMQLDQGRTLDYGCGYGFDAQHFGWECYDPYYQPRLPEGTFDTVLCLSVLNALSRNNRELVIEAIRKVLTTNGNAYFSVPRNLPRTGKLGMHHSLQNYVILSLPSIFQDSKLEIYHLTKNSVYKDKTREFLSRRDKFRLK